MNSQTDAGAREIGVDTENLYLEEVFTDLGAGTIRRLTPVKTDGSADVGRDILFMGQAQVMSAMGPLPCSSSWQVRIWNLPSQAFQWRPKQRSKRWWKRSKSSNASRLRRSWCRGLVEAACRQHGRWRRYSTAQALSGSPFACRALRIASGNEAFMFQPGVERPGGA